MRAKDIMKDQLITVPPEMLVSTLSRLLVSKRISGVPVVGAEEQVVGVVSFTDIASHSVDCGQLTPMRFNYYMDVWLEEDVSQSFIVEDFGSSLRVQDIMTRHLHQVDEETPLAEVARTMVSSKVHRLLVTRSGRLTGIVTSNDLVSLIPLLCEPAVAG